MAQAFRGVGVLGGGRGIGAGIPEKCQGFGMDPEGISDQALVQGIADRPSAARASHQTFSLLASSAAHCTLEGSGEHQTLTSP